MLNVIIGRNPSCDFRLLNGSVSRLHAVLSISDSDRLQIEDHNSRNGTFLLRGVTWRKVESAELERHDRVRFGEAEVAIADILHAVTERTKVGPGKKIAQIAEDEVISTEKALKKFKKPRRNRITGDIEEGG